MTLKYMCDNKHKEVITAREVCHEFSIPFDTTSKVMQVMNNHGLISSQIGLKGGYVLARDLKKVSVHKLVEIIEGKKLAPSCSDLNCDLIESCNIQTPISNLNQRLKSFFAQTSLWDLLFPIGEEKKIKKEEPKGITKRN